LKIDSAGAAWNRSDPFVSFACVFCGSRRASQSSTGIQRRLNALDYADASLEEADLKATAPFVKVERELTLSRRHIGPPPTLPAAPREIAPMSPPLCPQALALGGCHSGVQGRKKLRKRT
jgi:hypothetical protein